MPSMGIERWGRGKSPEAEVGTKVSWWTELYLSGDRKAIVTGVWCSQCVGASGHLGCGVLEGLVKGLSWLREKEGDLGAGARIVQVVWGGRGICLSDFPGVGDTSLEQV